MDEDAKRLAEIEVWLASDAGFSFAQVKQPRNLRQREADLLFVMGLLREQTARAEAAERVCAEAYQVVGALTHYLNMEGDDAIKPLDNLSAAADGRTIPHDTLLPSGRTPRCGARSDWPVPPSHGTDLMRNWTRWPPSPGARPHDPRT